MDRQPILRELVGMVERTGRETPEFLARLTFWIDKFDGEMVSAVSAYTGELKRTLPADRKTRCSVALIILGTALQVRFFGKGQNCQSCAILAYRTALTLLDDPKYDDARLAAMLNLANLLRDTEAGERIRNLHESHVLGAELLGRTTQASAEIHASALFNQGLCCRELARFGFQEKQAEAMIHLQRSKELWEGKDMVHKALNAGLYWADVVLNSPALPDAARLAQVGKELQAWRKHPGIAGHWSQWIGCMFALGHAHYRMGHDREGMILMSNAVAELPPEHFPQEALVLRVSLAEIHSERGEMEDCLRQLRAGEEALTVLLSRTAQFEEIGRLMSRHCWLYDRIIWCCLELGKPALAWTYAERNKTRALKGRAASFEELVLVLTREQSHVLQFHLAADFFVVFRIGPGMKEPLFIRHNQARLDLVFHALRRYLRIAEERDAQKWLRQQPATLREIGDLLDINEIVPDVEDRFRGLIVVPHRVLHMLPFGALRVRGKYLSEYSREGLRTALNCTSVVRGAEPPEPPVMPPGFFNRLFLVTNPTGDLDFAKAEAETIRPLFAEVAELREGQATLANLRRDRKLMESASSVHFACHGEYDPVQPLHSSLRLAHQTSLSIGTMLAERFDFSNCSLACLSACETGVIDLENFGDEYFGMGFAFLFLRAHNVLTTLWRLNDLSTAIFMGAFYATLKRICTDCHLHWQQMTAHALRAAQKRLMTISRAECMDFVRQVMPDDASRQHHLRRLAAMGELPYNHPYFWAPYVIVGR